jgi:hypothetical protein
VRTDTVDPNLVLDAVLNLQSRLAGCELEKFDFFRDEYEDVIAAFELVGRRRYNIVVKSSWYWPALDDVPVHASVLKVSTENYLLMSWTERDREPHALGFITRHPHVLLHIWIDNDNSAERTAVSLTGVVAEVIEGIRGSSH